MYERTPVVMRHLKEVAVFTCAPVYSDNTLDTINKVGGLA